MPRPHTSLRNLYSTHFPKGNFTNSRSLGLFSLDFLGQTETKAKCSKVVGGGGGEGPKLVMKKS